MLKKTTRGFGIWKCWTIGLMQLTVLDEFQGLWGPKYSLSALIQEMLWKN